MRSLILAALLACVSLTANAQLTPWQDYELSDEVYSVTTVKVDSNFGDDYLEGLANTWVPSTEIAKKLGHLQDYWIYRSDLPASGDFNLLLVVKFANSSDLAPNKARYDAFMKEFTKKRADESTEFAQKNYPGMRTITGEYSFRRIELK